MVDFKLLKLTDIISLISPIYLAEKSRNEQIPNIDIIAILIPNIEEIRKEYTLILNKWMVIRDINVFGVILPNILNQYIIIFKLY